MKNALPFWIKAVVFTGALLFAAGAIIAMIRPEMLAPAHGEINSAAHVYAGYFVSRNLALAVMLFAALITDARQALSGLMILAALVQFLDAGFDAAEGRLILIPGVILLGALFSLAAAKLRAPDSKPARTT